MQELIFRRNLFMGKKKVNFLQILKRDFQNVKCEWSDLQWNFTECLKYFVCLFVCFLSPNTYRYLKACSQLLESYLLYLKKYNMCCCSLPNSSQDFRLFFFFLPYRKAWWKDLMDFLYFRSLLWETVVTFERLHSLIIHIRSVTACVWAWRVMGPGKGRVTAFFLASNMRLFVWLGRDGNKQTELWFSKNYCWFQFEQHFPFRLFWKSLHLSFFLSILPWDSRCSSHRLQLGLNKKTVRTWAPVPCMWQFKYQSKKLFLSLHSGLMLDLGFKLTL